MSNLAQTGFDYAVLPVESALTARAAAERIKLRLKRTVEDIIEIGRELTAVKGKLPHGQFLPWIAAEFEMSEQTAQDFMRVFKRFGNEKQEFLVFKPSILYALAAPSTPEAVIEKAVEKGADTKVADIKDWKADYESERQARLVAEQRSKEWNEQYIKERDEKRAAEQKALALESQTNKEPEVVIKEVEKIPDDYESAKQQADNLQKELGALRNQQTQLIQQQVVAKLSEHQKEIDVLEHRANQLQATIADYQAHIAQVHNPALEMKHQVDAIEKFVLACSGLAAALSMFEHHPDDKTKDKWQKAQQAASDAATAIGFFMEGR